MMVSITPGEAVVVRTDTFDHTLRVREAIKVDDKCVGHYQYLSPWTRQQHLNRHWFVYCRNSVIIVAADM